MTLREGMFDMKTLRILLATLLPFGLAAVMAAPAFASTEWLLEGAVIPSTAKVHGESTGTIFLRDIKEKSQVECHVIDLWAVWAQFGEITEITTSLCKTTEGLCTSPTATAVDLPWLSELVASGSEIKNKLLANGKGEPGWQVKCLIIGIEVTDTCKGETVEPLVENTAGGDVLAIFNQGGIVGCTLGGANQGEIKGELLSAALEKLRISVSTEGAHEFTSSPETSGFIGKGGTQTITLGGNTVSCKSAKIDGHAIHEWLSMEVNYEECESFSKSATVSEADYTLNANGPGGIAEETDATIRVKPSAEGECVYTLAPKIVTSASYVTKGTGITISSALKGMAYELKETSTTACGTNGEKSTAGEYKGEVTTETYEAARCVYWGLGGFYFEPTCAISGGGLWELVSGYTTLKWS